MVWKTVTNVHTPRGRHLGTRLREEDLDVGEQPGRGSSKVRGVVTVQEARALFLVSQQALTVL